VSHGDRIPDNEIREGEADISITCVSHDRRNQFVGQLYSKALCSEERDGLHASHLVVDRFGKS
jgi:hypothetical protein